MMKVCATAPELDDGSKGEQMSSKGNKLNNDSERRRRLSNLINRMSEFEHFTANGAEWWTLPMAAAWFIWRNSEAVDDQWKIVTGAWEPAFDPPIYILRHH